MNPPCSTPTPVNCATPFVTHTPLCTGAPCPPVTPAVRTRSAQVHRERCGGGVEGSVRDLQRRGRRREEAGGRRPLRAGVEKKLKWEGCQHDGSIQQQIDMTWYDVKWCGVVRLT